MSMADGGCSSAQQEDLVVKKAQPNVLNKTATVGSSSGSSGGSPAAPAQAGISEAEMKKFKVTKKYLFQASEIISTYVA